MQRDKLRYVHILVQTGLLYNQFIHVKKVMIFHKRYSQKLLTSNGSISIVIVIISSNHEKLFVKHNLKLEQIPYFLTEFVEKLKSWKPSDLLTIQSYQLYRFFPVILQR